MPCAGGAAPPPRRGRRSARDSRGGGRASFHGSCTARAVDARELGDVAAHVVAGRVEPLGLRDRVEHAIRPRVDSRPRDPLPVAAVVRHIAVDEQTGEVRRAQPPVEVEVLGQERRRQQARAVVHEALARELAHAGVDDRVARATVLPGRQRLGVVAPAMAARAEVGVRDLRPGREQLRVEVAPAELAHERLGAVPATRALDQLERGEAAEMQVRARAATCRRQRGRRAGARSRRARAPASASAGAGPPTRLRAGAPARPRLARCPASAGSRPRASLPGNASFRGAATTARRGARRQRRQYGVKTR